MSNEKEVRIASLVSLFPLPQYVVVLEDLEKTHLVPIWIGVNEGNAIALEMNGEKFPRPLTHDLIVDMLTEVGVNVDRIVITDIKDNSYFAEIILKRGDESFVIDARPSDSLAIAVRTKSPIFIRSEVLEKCPIIDKPISEHDIDDFRKQLTQMSPEEFFKTLEQSEGKKKDIESVLGPLNVSDPEDEDYDDYDEIDEDEDEDDKDDPI